MKRFLIVVLCIIPFALNARNIDIKILDAINSPNTLPSDKYFKFLSTTTTTIDISVPLTIGVVGLVKNDKEILYNACTVGLSAALNGFVTTAMKYGVNRERPFNKYSFIVKKSSAGSASFPSGHSSSAFATATSLSLIYPKWYVIAPSYIWASSVAYSRMHLGVHYPSDVLCGIIIGAGCAYISYLGNNWLRKKYNYLGEN